MFTFEQNALVVISPNFPAPQCGATRFRWRMHCSLPFVLPTQQCLSLDFERDGFQFHAIFHNHLDRETLIPEASAGIPTVRLVQKIQDDPSGPSAVGGTQLPREHLQSVVECIESTEYVSSAESFKQAEKKIIAIFEFLGEHLGAIQRSLPYLVTWTIFPVSLFDVGVVHHAVEHFCPNTNSWGLIGCGVALSLARQLRAPLFFADIENLAQYPAELDLAHELLAEAQLALFRRMPRLAVLNAFTAVETLANSVFKRIRKLQLVTWGVPEPNAETMAEKERQSQRTNEKYLLSEGPKLATGRSLLDENKRLYDEVVSFESKVRHQVAHRGTRPSQEDAKACFRVCCEVVQWLCDVGGLPTKSLYPPPDQSVPGFKANTSEPYACSATDMELLRRFFNVVSHPKPPGNVPAAM